MVQNLNLIMITSPELADFRKRLRTLESKDGQTLFTILYRSWSHNAIATFSLCLLAQAYEQAYSLLQILSVPCPLARCRFHFTHLEPPPVRTSKSPSGS